MLLAGDFWRDRSQESNLRLCSPQGYVAIQLFGLLTVSSTFVGSALLSPLKLLLGSVDSLRWCDCRLLLH
jgi:hypothetical protein